MFKTIKKQIMQVLKGSYKLVKALLSIVFAIVIFSVVVFSGIYYFFARDLPDIKTIEDYRPPVISEVFAADGTKIGEFWLECRIFTPFNEIPKRIIQAFVDSEDARFFEHKGVDMRSIARAFVANLQAGEVTQGGSTITQQITRSLLLTRERSITRKIKEAILATRLERYLNKEQILTLYLNQIYLGNRAYGVAAAARNYFKKPLNELTLAQTALIAGLPTAPTNFSPVVNATEARKRQIHVLGRMLDSGHISKKEMKEAEEEEFAIYIAGIDKDFVDKDSSYFTEHVRRILKEKYGDDVLYHKGLKVYSTEDPKMQKAAVAAIQRHLEGLDMRLGYRGVLGHVAAGEIAAKALQLGKEVIAKQYGSEIMWPPGKKEISPQSINFAVGETYKAVVTDFRDKDTFIQIGDVSGQIKLDGLKWLHPWVPGTIGYDGVVYTRDPKSALKVGDVILARRLEDGTFALAQEPLIQGALFSMDPHSGYIKAMVGGYDFAKSEFNRVNQAVRQPGSSFKPFAYAAALDKGYTFNTTVLDAPITFHVSSFENWTPKNYGGERDFKGPLPFRTCLVLSRNIPTARITYDIGTHYLTAFERKLGISTPIQKYLSMALGANGVLLQEMVQAYSVYADNGVFKPAVAITKIEDSKGNVLESIYSNETKVEDEAKKGKMPEDGKIGTKQNKGVPYNELSPDLIETAIATIDHDKVSLTDLEIKTLYGSNIPSGHVITPQTAYLMVQLLKGVVESGTGTRVKALGKPAAGKTGTTNDETDAWFIGFVPDLAAGVWVGFDEVQKIGQKVAGGNTAAPIFVDYMKVATDGWEAKDFVPPEGFPEKDIGSLAGGSSIFGTMPKKVLGGGGGVTRESADRAGQFFEEDFESGGY